METTQTRPTEGAATRPGARLGAARLIAALVVALVALLGACSDSSSESGASDDGGPASSGAGSESQAGSSDSGSGAVEFAQCMRDNGVADFPDPASGGVFTAGGDVQADPDFDAAIGACQDMLPSGGGGGPVGGATSADLLEFAQCMRDNGVPDFPDPSPGGAVDVSRVDPNSPQFQTALETCTAETGLQLGGGQ